MATTVEVRFTPAEIATLTPAEVAADTCVVFDILRATSVFVTALAAGAAWVQPVGEIADALAVRQADPRVLLAGERHGLRLRAADTGGVDFDLGNSPREFTAAAVAGRGIVSTTTNGTRALRACAGAAQVFAAAFLNLTATARQVAEQPPGRLRLLCAGTGPDLAFEDVLGAGAFIHRLRAVGLDMDLEDSGQAALAAFQAVQAGWEQAVAGSRNARRLLAIPALSADVAWCSRGDVLPVVVQLGRDGRLVSG